ncbi:MAG: hypothetical protein E7665_00420 [Ruminococcaceae bacterium]|nr:hypothetical protein [Oscillospiraceae bacterium]
MKVYIMTDIEGAAGVLDFVNWAQADGKYHEEAKMLLTEEVNAAIDGFCAAGADTIFVCDGHGPGGIDVSRLDKRAYYSRGWHGARPFGLSDMDFDCMAFVGQHAMAGTPFSHLAHTENTRTLYFSINGIEVGEYGEMALIGSELGVPVIFASGEKAFAEEVEKLTPWVHTAVVKEGVTPGRGDECTGEEYRRRNLSAIHLSPQRARKLIREKSEAALRDFTADKEKFKLISLSPPYVSEMKVRAFGGALPYRITGESMTSIVSLMNGEGRRVIR